MSDQPCICGNATACTLPEYTIQSGYGDSAAGNQLREHCARTDRGKLVGITDKHHLTPVFQSIEQMPCQIDVQHRDLVHQNKIRVQHFRCAILSIITSEDSQRFVDRG